MTRPNGLGKTTKAMLGWAAGGLILDRPLPLAAHEVLRLITDAVASGDSAVSGHLSGNRFEFRAHRSARDVAAFRLVGEVEAVGTTAFIRARLAPHPLVRFALLVWLAVVFALLLATVFVAAWSFREPDAVGSLPLLGFSSLVCALPFMRVAATADDLWILSGWFESRFPRAVNARNTAES